MSSEFVSERGRKVVGHELYMLRLAFEHNPYPGLSGTFEEYIRVSDGVVVVRPFESLNSRIRSAGSGARVAVLSDVDGTLGQEREGLDESAHEEPSLDRQGWQNLMIPIFARFLADNSDLSFEESEAVTVKKAEYSMGKPTLVQTGAVVDHCHLHMERSPLYFDDVPLFDPQLVKGKYTSRLDDKVDQRRGVYSPEELRIAGPCAFLDCLKGLGYRVIFGSGTDVDKIKETLARLELDDLAEEGDIYAAGGTLKHWQCAKRYIVEMLKKEPGFDGRLTLAQGDGRPEIYEVANVGGISVAIATPSICKYNPDHFTSEMKRDGLIEAGATMYVEVDKNGGIDVQGLNKVVHEGVPERYLRTAKVRD